MHKKERRIIYLFSFLCIASLALNHFIPYLLNPTYAEAEDIESIIASFRKEQVEHSIKAPQKNYPSKDTGTFQNRKVFHSAEAIKPKKKPQYPEIQAFDFDPNKVSVDELKAMRLAPFLAERINNYRNKGGQFKEKNDLKKIYGITDSIFQKLAPFIRIEKSLEKKEHIKIATVSFIEINTATAEDFKALKGIGPVLSSRIIKYRDILGGFHQVEQLAETYGLPDSTFQSIEQFLLIEEQPITIDLNEAKLDELKKHPYINYQLAKLLVNYRKQHGNYSSVEEIKKIKILTADQFNKIAPYLNV